MVKDLTSVGFMLSSEYNTFAICASLSLLDGLPSMHFQV